MVNQYCELHGRDLSNLLDVPPGRLMRLSVARKAFPWFPLAPNGEPYSVATWQRWKKQGVRGHRLRTVSVGGIDCTCEQWVLEFLQALTTADAPSAPERRTPARRERAQAKAHRELDLAGI